jgi:hypothetical protein
MHLERHSPWKALPAVGRKDYKDFPGETPTGHNQEAHRDTKKIICPKDSNLSILHSAALRELLTHPVVATQTRKDQEATAAASDDSCAAEVAFVSPVVARIFGERAV